MIAFVEFDQRFMRYGVDTNSVNEIIGTPRGFGENGYLFSGSWGALVIILAELGSKLIILWIKGALPKSKTK